MTDIFYDYRYSGEKMFVDFDSPLEINKTNVVQFFDVITINVPQYRSMVFYYDHDIQSVLLTERDVDYITKLIKLNNTIVIDTIEYFLRDDKI